MIGILKCMSIVKMGIRRIYKNLYYNEEDGTYEFRNEQYTKQVVDQQSYSLIYIIEMLKELNNKVDPKLG